MTNFARQMLWSFIDEEIDEEMENMLRQEGGGKKSPCACVREARAMRQNLTEAQIDKTIADSFPASDPPAWY